MFIVACSRRWSLLGEASAARCWSTTKLGNDETLQSPSRCGGPGHMYLVASRWLLTDVHMKSWNYLITLCWGWNRICFRYEIRVIVSLEAISSATMTQFSRSPSRLCCIRGKLGNDALCLGSVVVSCLVGWCGRCCVWWSCLVGRIFGILVRFLSSSYFSLFFFFKPQPGQAGAISSREELIYKFTQRWKRVKDRRRGGKKKKEEKRKE